MYVFASFALQFRHRSAVKIPLDVDLLHALVYLVHVRISFAKVGIDECFLRRDGPSLARFACADTRQTVFSLREHATIPGVVRGYWMYSFESGCIFCFPNIHIQSYSSA